MRTELDSGKGGLIWIDGAKKTVSVWGHTMMVQRKQKKEKASVMSGLN